MTQTTSQPSMDPRAVAPSTGLSSNALVSVNLTAEVDALYDQFRDARFNMKYYGHRLAQIQRCNLVMEIAIALGTSGTFAALAIWNTSGGKVIFGILAGIAAVLGVMKPVLNLSKQIERVSKLWTEYSLAFNALRRAVNSVRAHHAITPDNRRAIEAVINRLDQLTADDDPDPSDKVRHKLWDDINAEFPMESFWWPEEQEQAA